MKINPIKLITLYNQLLGASLRLFIITLLGFIPLAITYVKYILTQTKEDYILYREPLYSAYAIPKNEEQEKE